MDDSHCYLSFPLFKNLQKMDSENVHVAKIIYSRVPSYIGFPPRALPCQSDVVNSSFLKASLFNHTSLVWTLGLKPGRQHSAPYIPWQNHELNLGMFIQNIHDGMAISHEHEKKQTSIQYTKGFILRGLLSNFTQTCIDHDLRWNKDVCKIKRSIGYSLCKNITSTVGSLTPMTITYVPKN